MIGILMILATIIVLAGGAAAILTSIATVAYALDNRHKLIPFLMRKLGYRVCSCKKSKQCRSKQ